MTTHSKIGASSSKRWMTCPGSVRLVESVPKSASSVYADEGTAAHALAELCLNAPLAPQPHAFIGETVGDKGFKVTKDMADAVKVYVDYIRGLNLPVSVECRFDLSSIYPGMFGTADAVAFDKKTQVLHVIDYKHGAGVAVEVENNTQLLYYAVGSAHENTQYPFVSVRLTVVQPRCPHPDGPVRSWDVDGFDLLLWTADLVEAAKRAEDPNAPLISGEHCRWCPAAGICPKLRADALAAAEKDFEDVTYTPEELAEALDQVPRVEAWVKAVREFAYAEAERGFCPPGYKLVAKRASRKWTNEDEVAAVLNKWGFADDDIYAPAKLKSPAQLEKAIGKQELDMSGYVVAESTGLTLVPITDRRQGVLSGPMADFS